jgi:hypothetical protein
MTGVEGQAGGEDDGDCVGHGGGGCTSRWHDIGVGGGGDEDAVRDDSGCWLWVVGYYGC